MTVKLFFVSQDEVSDYDTFSDFVCCAKDENDARQITPCGKGYDSDGCLQDGYGGWASNINNVKVELIGEVIEGCDATRRIICSSFHAG